MNEGPEAFDIGVRLLHIAGPIEVPQHYLVLSGNQRPVQTSVRAAAATENT